MEKDDRILRVLEGLQSRLGVGAFQVLDYWEGDLIAIGIAHPLDEHLLAYIAASTADERYYLELETSPLSGSEMPYEVVGQYSSVTFDELAELVAKHLRSYLV